MIDLVTLRLFKLDVWQFKDTVKINFCGLKFGNYRGLLAISSDDVNNQTRDLLKKILAACKLRVQKDYDLDSSYDFIVIFGTDVATSLTDIDSKPEALLDNTWLVSGNNTRFFVFPQLSMVAVNKDIKKQIWQTLSSYFQKLK